MNTNDKSQIAELAVAADLAKRGYIVSIPVGVAPYDLIVDRSSKYGMYAHPERVQVKYTSAHKSGVLRVELDRTRTTNKGSLTYHYDRTDFEWLAVYSPDYPKICYVPVDKIIGIRQYSLRIKPPKRSYPNIRLAEAYINI